MSASARESVRRARSRREDGIAQRHATRKLWPGPSEMGPKASAGTFADAAAFGEVIVLATLGAANESALRAAGPENCRGKVVIDATNPLDFSGGMPPELAVAGNDSGGEARAAPCCRGTRRQGLQHRRQRLHVPARLSRRSAGHVHLRQRRGREEAGQRDPRTTSAGASSTSAASRVTLSRSHVPRMGAARRSDQHLEPRIQAAAEVRRNEIV